MPDLDVVGAELRKELSAGSPRTPCLMMTALLI